MTALLLDDLGVCLLRELAEAWEAMGVTYAASVDGINVTQKSWIEEHWQRMDDYDRHCENFATYLILIGSQDIDIHVLRNRWERNLPKVEEERENGKLWDAIFDACRDYIDLYNAR
jgi:hypothetical protein